MKWIKCSEKYPLQDGKKILCISDEKDYFICHYLDDKWWSTQFRQSLDKIDDGIIIKAWMPLPPPPKD